VIYDILAHFYWYISKLTKRLNPQSSYFPSRDALGILLHGALKPRVLFIYLFIIYLREAMSLATGYESYCSEL
jgi:hypothetical protein